MEGPSKRMKYELTCKLCSNHFNLNTREPIHLFCCGQKACKECVQKEMIKSEDKNVIRKG